MQGIPKSISMLCAVLALGGCFAPQSAAPDVDTADAMTEIRLQLETTIREQMEMVKRVERVAGDLVIANAPLCGKRTTYQAGFSAVTRNSFGEDLADALESVYGVQKEPTVYAVQKGTDAARHLKERDVITRINGKKMGARGSGLKDIAKIAAEGNAYTLDVRRGKREFQVALMPVKVCDSAVHVEKDAEIGASANGDDMFITIGMLRFLRDDNDDELALTLGHELAHNIRSHIESKKANAVIGELLGTVVAVGTGLDFRDLFIEIGAKAYSQDFESEADYIGLYYAARAGYGIEEAPNLWRRMGADNPDSIHLAGTTHPSTAKRFLALKKAVAEIKRKQKDGAPLYPNEKP